ncbi:hypothetical protein BOTNAR_0108g00230 [Botryotinia narcissicola]|uniref:Uncharacterized protein n=1 Tax=Botryotinia narcissicola TaxID=278944 RepID=A0A4Z1ITM0_9HELO|nr:hypothetical protein BOTNAR_0108g00230 [Botryotinia narcissicola]
MASRKTYRWSASSNKYKEDKDGKFDADGDEITTYRWNSKGKFIRDINGKLDKDQKEVKKYKYCFQERYFRRDVEGTYNQKYVDDVLSGVKSAPKKSGITAGIKQQKRETEHNEERTALEIERAERAGAAEARQRQNRGESSTASTGGGAGGQPRGTSEERPRQIPSGRTLTAEEIAEQDREEVEGTARYHEPGVFPERQPPVGSQSSSDGLPGYGDHRRDYRDLRIAGPTEGPRNANPPPFSAKPPSTPRSTGLTPKLGKRVSEDRKPAATFGGRHNPDAPPGYSSDEHRRGNKSITSGSDGADRSGPDDLFKWNSSDQNSSPEAKTKPKSVPEPRATSRRRGSSKAAEPATTTKPSAQKEAPTKNPFTSRPLTSDSSLGDTENSLPKFLAQRDRSRTGDLSSRKRETSTGRHKGKMPVRTKEDPAKGSSSRKQHGSSSDDLYG